MLTERGTTPVTKGDANNCPLQDKRDTVQTAVLQNATNGTN